ncbi:competence/damage-inducible protein A [soil metagenome]
MRAKLLTIGDEILIGQIINSNAAFIGEKMYSIGIPVEKMVSIGDTEQALIEELDDSMRHFDVTLITGGLGPTHDDITKPVMVRYFNDELVLNEAILEHVKSFFEIRNIPMPEVNRGQAEVLKYGDYIQNSLGTAPGLWKELFGKIFVAMPGVPYEMKAMMKNTVLPKLKTYFTPQMHYVMKQKTLLTTGIGESTLSEMLGNINDIIDEDSRLAFLPSPDGVRMRINVVKANDEDADVDLMNIERKIREKTGKFIFGEGEQTIEEITGNLLIGKKLKLALAESCTGGLISSRITDIAGSSEYFEGGICTYSYDSKVKHLEVKKKTLKKYGAVSEKVAMQMAKGVRKKFKTDIGISATGIAGPGGATPDKPVGMVWIGYSDKEKTYAKKFLFGNSREVNKRRSSQAAIEILRQEVINK